jgi:hypothetical protein
MMNAYYLFLQGGQGRQGNHPHLPQRKSLQEDVNKIENMISARTSDNLTEPLLGAKR